MKICNSTKFNKTIRSKSKSVKDIIDAKIIIIENA